MRLIECPLRLSDTKSTCEMLCCNEVFFFSISLCIVIILLKRFSFYLFTFSPLRVVWDQKQWYTFIFLDCVPEKTNIIDMCILFYISPKKDIKCSELSLCWTSTPDNLNFMRTAQHCTSRQHYRIMDAYWIGPNKTWN